MSITKKGTKWEVQNSLWIIWSFLLVFNGIGMRYAGKKVKVEKWFVYGSRYTLIMFIYIIVGIKTKSDVIKSIVIGLFFITYIVCIIHSFKIRKEYLLKLELLEDIKTEPVEVETSKYQFVKADVTNDRKIYKKSDDNINSNEKIKKEKSDEKLLALEYNNVMPEIPKVKELNEFMTQENLLDINSCTESELAHLPGIGLILAKKAVNLRNVNNGFNTVDEFIQKLLIKPHFAVRLKTMICCIPIKNIKSEPTKNIGRMVDF